MSYAVRKDQKGYRAVSGIEDVYDNEYYSEVIPDLNPKKTFEEDLQELENQYTSDVDSIIRNFNIATLNNNEEEISILKKSWGVLKLKYDEDIKKLKKYHKV